MNDMNKDAYVNIKFGSVFSAIILCLFVSACNDAQKTEEDKFVKEVATKQASTDVAMLLPDFTKLLEHAGPSVVNIQASRVIPRRTQTDGASPFPDDDPFYDFWRQLTPNGSGDGNQGAEPIDDVPVSYGSGFITSSDGYILTNAHVVNNTSNIKVTLNDKREFQAKLIGLDISSDIALLKIEADNLSPVEIGSSTELKVGEWVTAIGAPFGFDNTLTAGIVSAKGRSLPNDNYTPFIQTDVAINPGNSGGPLFNLKGQVVGINSRIYSGAGGFMGISFSIPSDIAMNVAEQLRTTGKVSRGQLGVQVQEVDYNLAKSFGLEKPKGALVVKVTPAGPADLGKVESGDIIISVNDKPVESSKDLPMMIGAIAPGQTIKLGMWRNQKEITTNVKLGEMSNSITATTNSTATQPEEAEGELIADLGLDLGSLTDNIKADSKLDHGLLVLNATGKAAAAGIIRGDIILTVNATQVSSVEEFKSAFGNGKESVPLLLKRGKDTLFVALKVN